MERQASVAGPDVAFGTFRLFVTQRVLMEGDRAVRLGSRALEILFALLEHPGELVRKARLIQRVWPDVVVEEGTLRVHIAALRKVLGEGHSGTRYIENVSGVGYRFVAPVSKLERSDDENLGGAAGAHSLLPALHRVIGRTEVVAALVAQVPKRRFVTIVGPGGIGKTTVGPACNRATIGGQLGHYPLLVPAATPLSSFGSALGASAMGYALERGGLTGALGLSMGALGLTAFLTIPFLKRRAFRSPINVNI